MHRHCFDVFTPKNGNEGRRKTGYSPDLASPLYRVMNKQAATSSSLSLAVLSGPRPRARLASEKGDQELCPKNAQLYSLKCSHPALRAAEVGNRIGTSEWKPRLRHLSSTSRAFRCVFLHDERLYELLLFTSQPCFPFTSNIYAFYRSIKRITNTCSFE